MNTLMDSKLSGKKKTNTTEYKMEFKILSLFENVGNLWVFIVAKRLAVP